MPRKPSPNPKPRDAAVISAVVTLVGGGTEREAIATILQAGVTQDDAGLVLIEARKRIQLAADYHRDEQLGLAIMRLNRLIELNLEADLGDHGVTLRAQIELNKLLRLHEVNTGAAGGEPDEATDRADELGRARAHLAPLFAGTPDDYPLSELARMAAEKVRTAHGGGDTEA